MEQGKFYFLSDEYYNKFPNCSLMGNKETDEFGKHSRPCFYCFKDNNLYWMIPISSKIEKYRKIFINKSQNIKIMME